MGDRPAGESARRSLALCPILALMACAAPAQTPIHGVVPGYKCEAAPVQGMVGQIATQDAGARIMSGSHSASLRWIPPGVMVTMDYSESRVNVRLDNARVVLAITCG